jgi:shikimate kinase
MIRRDGESLFRQAEVDILGEALLSDGVVATGGGVVSTEAGRARLLEHGVVLWLRVSAETGLARVRGGDRPLLAGDLDATYRHTLEERRAWYEAVATWTIDGDADVASVIASVEEIVQG